MSVPYILQDGQPVYTYQLNANFGSLSNQNAGSSAKNFGATGNGVTNDSAALLAAQAAGFASGVYLSPGTYYIGTNTAFTASVQFAPGAMLLIGAGVTVTFQVPITASLLQIFSGTGLVKFIYGTTVYPEWWGAVPSLTIDSSPAINAALASLATCGSGVVILQANIYLIKSTIMHTQSGVKFRGQGANATTLYCGTIGMDGLYTIAPGTVVPQLGGGGTNPPPAGGTAIFNSWPGLYGFTILQPTATAAGTGITNCYTAEARIEDILISGYLVAYSQQRATNTQMKHVDGNNTLGANNNVIGFKIDGSSQIGDNGPLGGNASSRYEYCTFSGGGNQSGYGYYIYTSATGALAGTLGDLHFLNPETNFCNFGMYFNLTQTLMQVDGTSDILITNPTLDTNYQAGIYIQGAIWTPPVAGVPVVTQQMNISIMGGWSAAYGSGAMSHISLSNTRGVSITGYQFFAPYTTNPGTVTGLTIVDAVNTVVTGCTFNSLDHWITMSKVTNAPGYNTITGNRFYGSADNTGAQGGHTPNPGIVATGVGNIISSNVFDGLYGAGVVTGVYLDANSSSNIVSSNVFNKASAAPIGGGTASPIYTNTIVNSGTGNVLANNIS